MILHLCLFFTSKLRSRNSAKNIQEYPKVLQYENTLHLPWQLNFHDKSFRKQSQFSCDLYLKQQYIMAGIGLSRTIQSSELAVLYYLSAIISDISYSKFLLSFCNFHPSGYLCGNSRSNPSNCKMRMHSHQDSGKNFFRPLLLCCSSPSKKIYCGKTREKREKRVLQYLYGSQNLPVWFRHQIIEKSCAFSNKTINVALHFARCIGQKHFILAMPM